MLKATFQGGNCSKHGFFILFFPEKKRGPLKIHPQEIHLLKVTFQKSTQKSGQEIHIAPLQGHVADKK